MFVQNFGGTLLTASIDIDRFTLYRPLYVGKLTRQMRVCLWIKTDLLVIEKEGCYRPLHSASTVSTLKGDAHYFLK
jgi:hypothetical protein